MSVKPFAIRSNVGYVPPQQPSNVASPLSINQAAVQPFKQIFYHFNLSPPDLSYQMNRLKKWYVSKITMDGRFIVRGNIRFFDYTIATGSQANMFLFKTYDPDGVPAPAVAGEGQQVHTVVNFEPPLLIEPEEGLKGLQLDITQWSGESTSNSMYFSVFGFEFPE